MHRVGLLRPTVVGQPASTLRDLALLAQGGQRASSCTWQACWLNWIVVTLAAVCFGAASGLTVAGIGGSLWAFPLSLFGFGAAALLLSRGLRELLAPPPPSPHPLAEEIALEEEVCALLSSRIEEGMVVLNEVWIPIPGSIRRCSHLLVGSGGIVLLLACPVHGEFTARRAEWEGWPRSVPPLDRVAAEMQRTVAVLITGLAGKLRIARPELASLLVHAAVVVPNDTSVGGRTLVPVLRVSELPRWYEALPPIGGWALGWRFQQVAATLAYELRRLVTLRPPAACLPRN